MFLRLCLEKLFEKLVLSDNLVAARIEKPPTYRPTSISKL